MSPIVAGLSEQTGTYLQEEAVFPGSGYVAVSCKYLHLYVCTQNAFTYS